MSSLTLGAFRGKGSVKDSGLRGIAMTPATVRGGRKGRREGRFPRSCLLMNKHEFEVERAVLE